MIRIIRWDTEECRKYTDRLTRERRIIPEDVLMKVRDIAEDVRKRGDEALLEYTRRFDGVELDAGMLKVTGEEIDAARKATDPALLETVRKAARNIRRFHENQKGKSWFLTGENGEMLGQRLIPMERVGIYVPGGTAPLISSVLMNAIPAKVAGVDRIIMGTPPQKDGSVNAAVLAAAYVAGVDEVYRMGGAQAIAAMAFGTGTVPAVDKIAGPGNIYVTAAKKLVFGTVDIDMIAGPSEIAVIADDTANPEFVAADLLSQAEHDGMAAAILLTDSERMAEAVVKEIERQYARLPRKEIAAKSLKNYGAAIVTESIEEAVELANKIAPEHLEICVKEPLSLMAAVRNAGALFLGDSSPEPVGDYFAGPNHVLPTGGTARFFSPLGVYDFIKRSSVICYTPQALAAVYEDVLRFAEAEGLDAHANAVRIRAGKNGSGRESGSGGENGSSGNDTGENGYSGNGTGGSGLKEGLS